MTPHSCNRLHYDSNSDYTYLYLNATQLSSDSTNMRAPLSLDLLPKSDGKPGPGMAGSVTRSARLFIRASSWCRPRLKAGEIASKETDEVQRRSAILAKEGKLACVAQSLPKSHRGPHYLLLYGLDSTTPRSDGSDTLGS